MKKYLALTLVLALAFSTNVFAAEPNLDRIETLANVAEKSLPEYTSNAVAKTQNIEGLAVVASGSDMVTEGKETNATCVVDKTSTDAIVYATNKAAEIGGTMVTTVELSAPGVNLVDAQATLAVLGVKADDAVSVFKCVKGEWVAVDVTAVADNCITIKFDGKGIYTVIK